jgi:hypothetical protein
MDVGPVPGGPIVSLPLPPNETLTTRAVIPFAGPGKMWLGPVRTAEIPLPLAALLKSFFRPGRHHPFQDVAISTRPPDTSSMISGRSSHTDPDGR